MEVGEGNGRIRRICKFVAFVAVDSGAPAAAAAVAVAVAVAIMIWFVVGACRLY